MADQNAAAAEQPSASTTAQAPAASGTAPDRGSQTTAAAGTAPATGDPATPASGTAPEKGDAAAAAEKPAAPEQYADFTVPEGYALEGDMGDKFKALAKEMGLTQDQAQKLIDLDVQRSNAHVETVQKATHEWLNMSKADKEIGGESLGANVAIATKALDAFGSPELKSLLKVSGLGNHPEIIRAFYKVGKAISEDGFVPAGGGDKSSQARDAKSLYPNSDMK